MKNNMDEETPKEFEEPPPVEYASTKEINEFSFYKAIIAEFVATLLFMYIGLTAIIGANIVATNQTGSGIGLVGIAWTFGATIFILVYCIAGISGGHINPAVTFGLLIARKVTLIRATTYIAAQCLGAMCGAALAKSITGKQPFEDYGGGVNDIHVGYTVSQALGAEIVGTFVLLYTVLNATDPERNARDSHVPVLAPLPIGFAVFVIHLATIPITGTGINPARSLGSAVVHNQSGDWTHHWIFWVGPLIGATCASLYHVYVVKVGSVHLKNLLEN